MAGNERYRLMSNPANVCRELQKRIKTSSRSISLDEVREVITDLEGTEWSEADVIGFFKFSPQKIFMVVNNRLCLNNQESSSDDESPKSTPDPEPARRSPPTSRDATYSGPNTADSSGSDSEMKRAIKLVQKSSRTLQTKSELKSKIVLAPKNQQRHKVRLVSSTSDSESDDDTPSVRDKSAAAAAGQPASGRNERPPARINLDKSASDDETGSEVERSCPIGPAAQHDPEEEAARKMEMRDLLRARRENSLAGFFDRHEQLDEEQSGRHDPIKIHDDLVRFTNRRLNDAEIEAYVEYVRQLLGGNIEHLSTGSVVAAVLDLYEVDESKEKLNEIMRCLEEVPENK